MLNQDRSMDELTEYIRCAGKTIGVHLWNIRHKSPIVITYDPLKKLYSRETKLDVKGCDE